MSKNEIKLMSYEEASDYFSKRDIAILPIGSIEQHGPANPLGTDSIIAEALAKEASRRTGTLCLPLIPVGISFHHINFPGTLSVSERALEQYTLDLISSLARWGVRKVLIINGHGGNLPTLQILSRRAREDLGVYVYIYQWWNSPKLEDLFDSEERGHAAAAETSLIMYLCPEAVNTQKLRDESLSREEINAVRFVYTDEISRSGIMGRQSSASAYRGRELFEKILEDLIEVIEKIRG